MMESGTGAAQSGAPEAAYRHRRREAWPTDQARMTAADAGAVNDERDAVDAVLAGDREAFRRLVERESRAVIAACTRILGDRTEAEDVAQEAFVTAYRSLATWRADGPFGAWLSRIAVRLAIRRAAQRKRVTWLDPVADVDSGTRTVLAAGDAVDPATSVLRSERDAQLRAAVAALEEPYREVVALRFFAERSLAEIADVTDRPLGTVKTHLHRGLARLRRTIEEADR
jgi:RNA polymerase sigma-70 factor (ECF subfamily)